MDRDGSVRFSSITLAKQFSCSFKMEDVESLFHALELDEDFDGDINDTVRMSCFMRSNVISVTGYFEQTVPRYLLYEFKHHFRMTRRTFQLTDILSRNKSPLRALDSQNIHLACAGSSYRTVVTDTWMYE